MRRLVERPLGVIGLALIALVLLATACYAICYFAFRDMTGLAGMFVRSAAFILLYSTGAVYMKLSPDIQPVLQSIRRRFVRKDSVGGIKRD